MKRVILLIALMLTLALLVSCLPSQETVSQEQSSQNNAQEQENSRRSTSPEPSETESAPRIIIPKPRMNTVMEELVNKNKQATNYNYAFDAQDARGYEVYRIGNKIKKVYTDTVQLRNEVYYNKVYLDLDAQKAIGICDKSGITCSDIWNQAFEIDIEKENIYPSPVEIMNQVNYAESVGSENFDDRALTIIEYTNPAGNKERLSVDKYYGLPLRQVIYDADGIIKEKHTFTKIAVGQLQEEDVTLPPQYKVVG